MLSAPMLRNSDLVELTQWRRELHRYPEVSGEEAETAKRVLAMLVPSNPSEIISDLGGHGVAAIYQGQEPGPTVLLRCELDALPITELGNVAYQSTIAGKGHLCGHDGHMAILAAVARVLGRNPPKRGRVVVLFQPAEEDGSGAARVIADPRYGHIRPDYAFSLHNMPGVALGRVALCAGPINCASRGLRIGLVGKTAHASEPDKGVSPMAAMAVLMPGLTALGAGGDHRRDDFRLVTVTHAHLGEPAFGIAPGQGEIWATLRCLRDGQMAALCAEAEALAMQVARDAGLGAEISYHDVFLHCENHPEAVQIVQVALDAQDIAHDRGTLPMRASEDFGRFGGTAKSAMFMLGAGQDHASLHNPDYDFPDDLIAIGAGVFLQVVADLLGD